MFSSVLCGTKNVTEDFFIIPGDIPFISAQTYSALLNGHKPLRFPSYKGKEGHPLFISIELKDKLLKEPIDSNLKKFRDEQDKEIIPVDDPYILKDIDTLKEYETLLDERK
jgi:CTP:molybdopterin cytidylyltransferase MocA